MRACFFTACTGPPGCAVHFREFSASRGGCIRAGSVYLISRDPSTGDLGRQAAYGVAIARVSRRAVPQSDAGRAMLPVRGVAGGGRDAEYSGFCTVQAGVRWDGRGAPIYLCMAQVKICRTIGRHAPDAQIGRAIRRRSPRPFRAVRESKGEGSYGRAGGPADGGVAAELALAVGDRAPWAPALDGRMLLLATHDAADARALNISDIITL